MIEDSQFRLEPRFYPSYPMKVGLQHPRAHSTGKRAALGLAYNAQIQELLFERIEKAHPDWSPEQHKMMFFKLRYAGEHFTVFSQAKIERGGLTVDEVAQVKAIPIPETRAQSEKYTAISHPDLDNANNVWPSLAERAIPQKINL